MNDDVRSTCALLVVSCVDGDLDDGSTMTTEEAEATTEETAAVGK